MGAIPKHVKDMIDEGASERRRAMRDKWHEPAMPRSVVQMIPVDPTGHVLVMHRSDKVRSIPNVWSFPSGVQEIGERMEETLRRELLEEYGLEALDAVYIGHYENIAGDPQAEQQYHWLIGVYVALVIDVTQAVNKEPDKHDMMKFVDYRELATDLFWKGHQFHPSFHEPMIQGGMHRLALACQHVMLNGREAKQQ